MPNASQGDLFSYKLDYETAGYYDGNIGKQYWQASTNNAPTGIRTYTFTYDAASRLKTATYSGIGSESYGLPTVNYDRNGNITSMQRNGKLTSTYGLMDNLTYTYTGNRLMRVEDGIAGDYDVDFVNRNSGTDDYTYEANGALKSDKNEAINDIIYSTYVNQPIEVQLTSSRWIKNSYDGAGRLYKTSYSTGEYWEYLDGLVFKNGAFYQLATPEGRAVYQSGAWSYEYFHTDHLGNTRVAYKANGTTLTKTSETSFDPWGVVLNGINLLNSYQNRFEFLNREKESTFNLRYIRLNARGYNPTVGRFDRVDPIVDEQEQYSTYQYGWNNPVLRSDPNGDCPLCLTALAGAAGGAAFEYGSQVVGNLFEGKSIKESFTNVDGAAVGKAALIGAVTGAGGGLLFKGVTKVATKFLDKADDTGRYVYRALSKTDDVTEGLSARSPGTPTKPVSHVAGKKQTEWISTTKNKATAVEKYNREGNGVVKIDLKKVKTEVKDVSGGIDKGGRMSNYAKRDQEVLIKDHIPAKAIKWEVKPTPNQ